MKKSLVLTAVGLGLLAGASATFGQGNVVFGNYQGAYNAVVWDGTGAPVKSTDGVDLMLYYGKGSGVAASALTAGVALPWDLTNEGNGYPGYYSFTKIVLPNWASGDTYTFQIRASGAGLDMARSVSALFTEQGAINAVTDPPTPAGQSPLSIGLTVYAVPEPTTLALVGLGAAGLLAFRRRS